MFLELRDIAIWVRKRLSTQVHNAVYKHQVLGQYVLDRYTEEELMVTLLLSRQQNNE